MHSFQKDAYSVLISFHSIIAICNIIWNIWVKQGLGGSLDILDQLLLVSSWEPGEKARVSFSVYW